MATLNSILQSRSPPAAESNLEKGKIWAFSTVVPYTTFGGCHCWIAPGNGSVELEVIGAGGSGSRMCCCHASIPGNSGAYVKRTGTVQTGCWICMYAGKSCRNASSLCSRGCSEAGMACWQMGGTNGCICAEGGRGGTSFCTTSPPPYCCFKASNWCRQDISGYCGLICNMCPGGWLACAYGGDSAAGNNLEGVLSCTTWWHCYPNCNCSTTHHVAVAPGYFAKCGGVASYGMDSDNGQAQWSGMALNTYYQALNSLSRMPGFGNSWTNCWNGVRHCGCYDTQGCDMWVPHGAGGPASTSCSGVRDNGWAGGDAIIKVKYIAS